MGIIFAAIFVGVIITAIKRLKGASIGEFNKNFNQFTNDMGFELHKQAHNEAMRLHNEAVHQHDMAQTNFNNSMFQNDFMMNNTNFMNNMHNMM